MRKRTLITAIILLVLTACDYAAPLVGEASLPIDPALVGTWEMLEERDGQEPSLLRVVIRQKSANQYEIAVGNGGESTDYAIGWLAELEGIRFLQTQYTGDKDGPVDVKYTRLFSVYSYALHNDELVLQQLNKDLVNTNLTDTAALQAAFVANRDNPSLFHEPGQFKKL
jgi:hypothetical protein